MYRLSAAAFIRSGYHEYPINWCGHPNQAECDPKQYRTTIDAKQRHAIRRLYRCDCDGESHKTIGREVHLPVVKAIADALSNKVKEACGASNGDGCIWRALKDPLVRCTEARWIYLRSNPALYVNEDMPALLVDAAQQYHTMRTNADYHFEKARNEKAAEKAAKDKANSKGIVTFRR